MQLGYAFNNPTLYQRALTHKSFSGPDSNERLELLGDSVLNLVVTEYLLKTEQGKSEGGICELRSTLVNNKHLANCARRMGLGSELLMGCGEEAHGGRDKDRALSCALEALIGAIYLDGGLWKARDFVARWIWN